MTPQETDPDFPVSVQESPVEVWVSGGLLQGWVLSVAVHAWDILKEVTIIFITSTRDAQTYLVGTMTQEPHRD